MTVVKIARHEWMKLNCVMEPTLVYTQPQGCWEIPIPHLLKLATVSRLGNNPPVICQLISSDTTDNPTVVRYSIELGQCAGNPHSHTYILTGCWGIPILHLLKLPTFSVWGIPTRHISTHHTCVWNRKIFSCDHVFH